MDKTDIKNLINYALIIGLFILAIIIINPIIQPIIFGILLGYIFLPIYKIILKKLKNENLSAIIVCIAIIVIIFISASLMFTTLLKQSINFYFAIQKLDMVTVVREILPSSWSSTELSTIIASSISTSISNLLAAVLSRFNNLVLNVPVILLKLFVTLFVFFFSLKDGEKAIEYLKSLSPLKKEVEERFFKQFRDVTNSVLVGQIIVGILQGIIAGIGYFIFGVPNALLITLLTIIIGIIPLIGPWLVWIPVDIYLFASGKIGAGIGLLIYGAVLINWIDTIVRPLIVSRKTQINSAIVIIGMIGGLFVFGVLGLIIGPLILAYVLLVFELYRKDKMGDDLIFKKLEK
ncbi:AI-2E family transporter [Candidatus Pacearchaeota archaeon]|nr:AI-2E family transporter [Candidatus Pacearchaeota archaeon]MBD3282919.1 AI-2E family transporter [Candidatus Pacearchaeota archaeon]